MRYFLALRNGPFLSNVSCKVTTLCLKIPFYMGAVRRLDFTESNFLFIYSISTKYTYRAWNSQQRGFCRVECTWKQIPRQKTITTNRTSIFYLLRGYTSSIWTSLFLFHIWCPNEGHNVKYLIYNGSLLKNGPLRKAKKYLNRCGF